MIVSVGNITEQPIQQKQEKEPSKKRKRKQKQDDVGNVQPPEK